MYFKELHMVGFKSFANKTELKFEPGVTAIVGPNGCGKSNISDSIRWVLGEQSAKDLRGTKMEDVIFNGTDTQEPLNMAEVSLTLNNEAKLLPVDYQEVTITRRLFRTGESEYLLNKTPVRLKDISELLMGTGLGTDSYSIIGQGKMDLILSSQPSDRRYIFEEASGITKYKSKKKEALRKLEQTESNLLRINDIVTEVQRQINSIERQAKKAEKYKEVFERLKELDSKAAYFELGNLRNKQSELVKEESAIKEAEARLGAEIGEFLKKLEDAKISLNDFDKRLEQIQTKSFELELTINEQNGKMVFDQERIKEYGSRKESSVKEIDEMARRIAELKSASEGYVTKLNSVSQDRSRRQEDIKKLEDTIGGLEALIKDTEENIKRSKLGIVDMLNQQTRLRNNITRITSDIQNKSMRSRRLEVERQKAQEDLAAVLKELEDAGGRVSQTGREVEGVKNDLTQLKELFDKASLECAGITKDINILESQKIALNSKLEFLIDLVKRHEGFSSAVKSLLTDLEQGRLNISGIYGVVANLIEPEKGFELAAEAALGDMVQAVVVEDLSTAKSAIGSLGIDNVGRVTFAVKEKFVDPSDSQYNVEGTKGRLTDYIKAKNNLEPVFKNLLRDVYVVDDISGAFDVYNRLNDARVILVTLNGDVIRQGVVTVSGKIQSENNLLVGRESRISQLRREIEQLAVKADGLHKERIEKENAAKELNDRMDALEEQRGKLEINFAEQSSVRSNIEEKKKRLEEELSLVDLETGEIKDELDTNVKTKENAESELKKLDDEHAKLQGVIADSQSLIDRSKQDRENDLVAVTQIKTELASVDKEEVSLRQTIEVYSSSLKDMEASIKIKKDEITGFDEKVCQLSYEVKDLGEKNVSLDREKQSVEKELNDVKTQRLQLVSSMTVVEQELTGRKKELDSSKDRYHAIELNSRDMDFRIGNLKEKTLQSYKIDLEQLVIQLEENINWGEVNAEIQVLREKIDKMGEVNLVAIEEHKELQDRLSFLEHQREDLVSAKDSLEQAIKKINKTTKELFLDTFAKIQVEFKNFFRLLFGGGQAELMLLDEQDVLESGIEIIVRPPGKKLQSITLLSGGEKALTAIALLLAIFKIKPSPFCILDEIDAPLDESNVDRFCNVLRDFLTASQFIIITHNKKTMMLADVMYGITMQEKGISKIVSVKLAERKKEAKDMKEPVAVT